MIKNKFRIISGDTELFKIKIFLEICKLNIKKL